MDWNSFSLATSRPTASQASSFFNWLTLEGGTLGLPGVGECNGLKLALNLLVRGSNVEHKTNVGDVLECEGAALANEAVAEEVATAPASVSHSLIIGALQHLFKTGCGIGGSTSIDESTECFAELYKERNKRSYKDCFCVI